MFIAGDSLWLAATNTWVIARESPGPAVIVDAPPDPGGIVALLRRHELAPVALLATHGHVDHLGGAGTVAREFALSAFLHPDDAWLATDPAAQARALWGFAPPGEYAPPERWESLAHDQMLDLAGIAIRVLHTPGHTPGHCCFHVAEEGVLFSGDQLFAGSIGRTDLPGGDTAALMHSMEERILPLPAPTAVLPGHGPTTTLAHELATNPFLEAFRT